MHIGASVWIIPFKNVATFPWFVRVRGSEYRCGTVFYTSDYMRLRTLGPAQKYLVISSISFGTKM